MSVHCLWCLCSRCARELARGRRLVVRAATVPAGANGFKDFAQLIQGGWTAAHLIMVAAAKPKRKHAVEPAGRKHVRLGFDGVSPSLFRERLFLKDGRVSLRCRLAHAVPSRDGRSTLR